MFPGPGWSRERVEVVVAVEEEEQPDGRARISNQGETSRWVKKNGGQQKEEVKQRERYRRQRQAELRGEKNKKREIEEKKQNSSE